MSNQNRSFSLSNYPLCWPDGWVRTASYQRKTAHFKRYGNRASVMEGLNRILDELSKMSIRRDDVLISTNVPTRLDGMPRSDQREPTDAGVAVYWRKNQNAQMQCMAIDIYQKVSDNLCAVAATLEAMRAIERHGGAQVQERTFRGFAALPASTRRLWRDVFGVVMTIPTEDLIDAQFKSLLRVRHPDTGGSNEAMAELNQAREDALQELKNR
jgi:hypothetical protein